ncbi:malonic semialdehyde reductase [Acetobacter conturbans]|uniref:Malonic semialdehyde reductase n=1 Tax=Acetobacter conturbans TaxID=1737472 RepID=A0ABX0K330_9PROT|nr:malonic semialdehyde reductase [Acetobacter conturbans]NHN89065.1 malonic semialdehyde reductase [Acetobacter conturbans]
MSLDENALDCLFQKARTPEKWTDRPVPEETVRALYDLVKLGPTSGNGSPARFVFLSSQDAKERLRDALSAGNVEKVMTAPVVVIVGHDPLFFEYFSRLGADPDLRSWFAADVGLAEETAFRNGTLEGAYLIMAARALGLDALPMSGFDAAIVEDTFLTGEGWRANFLIGLGYGEPVETPRAARLAFDEACRIL